ncbi:hypothetical protein KY363_03945 [Candidatus Woesearchaeota archaeon]|nr:hypothetical protein [Candidatus Woesearchaeota archaeon]
MERCIVCNEMSTGYNTQGLPMCKKHMPFEAIELRCPVCRDHLDVRKSKYGAFFTCISCGAISVHKLKRFGNLYFEKK